MNSCIPEKYCSVKYRDLDHAINTCLKLKEKLIYANRYNKDYLFEGLFQAKTDLTSAFRLLPVKCQQWKWTVMGVPHPITGTKLFFVDKNIPFGASLSCRLFQSFSDCLCHIIETITGKKFQVTNYLDDFYFIEETEQKCNRLVDRFISLCAFLNCPLSQEKTVRATKTLIFLGILLNTEFFVLCLPEDKVRNTLAMIRDILAKRKIMVKGVQRLTGTLNFLSKALVPGRAFTRKMYAKLTGHLNLEQTNGKYLRSYHRITLDSEFLNDCQMWEKFLCNADSKILCRPFIDLKGIQTATKLNFYTDASGSLKSGGFGAIYNDRWIFGIWEKDFMKKCNPSIEFLELYALCLGIFTWATELTDCRIVVFCDNKSVRDMVNSTSSKCDKCMKLIRLLVLNCLQFNRKIYVLYVETHKNTLADALSRGNFRTFWKFAPANTRKRPDHLPDEIWPVAKFWKWY